MIPRPSLPLSIIFESSKKGFISSAIFPLLSCSTQPSCCPPVAWRRRPYRHHCWGSSCENTFVLGQVTYQQMLASCWPSTCWSSAGFPVEPGNTVLFPVRWCTHTVPGPWTAQQQENPTLLLESLSPQQGVSELSLSPHGVSPSHRN